MKVLDFMTRHGEQKHITESYVSIPPALIITDEAGNIWTLGFKMGPISGGEYTFNVLCNGVDTHEYANRIERRRNRIWIFGSNGWKTMKVVKQTPTRVYAVGAKVNEFTLTPVHFRVSVYFDGRLDMPVVSFAADTVNGGLEDLTLLPIFCEPGSWLNAIIQPKEINVTVAGYLGERLVREIPIRKGAET